MASARREGWFSLQAATGSRCDTTYDRADPVVRGEAPTCEVCGRFVGMRAWLPERAVTVETHGDRCGDFAFRTRADFLVSDTALKGLRGAELRGIYPEDLSRVRNIGNPTPRCGDFRWLKLSRDGQLDESASRVAWTTEPRDCLSCGADGLTAVKGFEIDSGSQPRLDLFVLRDLPGVAVVSHRFVDVATDLGLTNVEFIPSQEFEWDPLTQL